MIAVLQCRPLSLQSYNFYSKGHWFENEMTKETTNLVAAEANCLAFAVATAHCLMLLFALPRRPRPRFWRRSSASAAFRSSSF